MSLHVVFRYVGKTDSITISVWNHKKIHKKQGAGFLGCVRLLSNAISRLKDTGCKKLTLFCLFMQLKKAYEASFFFLILNTEFLPSSLVNISLG